MPYENILVETHGHVGLIKLNRPKALNALSDALVTELAAAVDAFEADDEIGCIVLTGSERAFAAGADIKEMASQHLYGRLSLRLHHQEVGRVATARKPVIAAVAGYALGGGCELAMMCDFILAADTAKFGQPEITIGTIPGAGGTQRLTRVRRQVQGDGDGPDRPHHRRRRGRALRSGQQDRPRRRPAGGGPEGGRPHRLALPPVVMMAKESVNRAYETTLEEGIRFERRLFHSTFATEDQKEGMAAFTEKREANFQNR